MSSEDSCVKTKRHAEFWGRSCLRKARFEKLERAEKVANKFNQRPYFCALCDGFHLTKKEEVKNPLLIDTISFWHKTVERLLYQQPKEIVFSISTCNLSRIEIFDNILNHVVPFSYPTKEAIETKKFKKLGVWDSFQKWPGKLKE